MRDRQDRLPTATELGVPARASGSSGLPDHLIRLRYPKRADWHKTARHRHGRGTHKRRQAAGGIARQRVVLSSWQVAAGGRRALHVWLRRRLPPDRRAGARGDDGVSARAVGAMGLRGSCIVTRVGRRGSKARSRRAKSGRQGAGSLWSVDCGRCACKISHVLFARADG